MNEYQEKFIKNKIDNEMSRDERFALAKKLAERNGFETPIEMEILNEKYNDKTPLEIISEFCQDDFNVDDDYFMPDVGQGIKSMDDEAIDEWINDTVSDCLSYTDAESLDLWDDEEYGEWLLENYSYCFNEAIPTNEDFPYSSDLSTHAEQFAKRWCIELEILGCEYKKHFIDDNVKRYVFKCRLINKHHEKYEFEFGQSIANGSTEPDMYDILSCLTKSDPCTYKDFCAEFGYAGGEDSLETYHNVKKEWEAVLRLFGPENGKCMEELREIC